MTNRYRRVALVLASVLVTAAGVALVIGSWPNAADGPSGVGATERSAWESRLELEQLLIDTAQFAGLSVDPGDADDSPLICRRESGEEGFSYFLRKYEAEPVGDVRGLLDRVEDFWVERGFEVVRGDVGGTHLIQARSPAGEILEVFAGPGGVAFSGESRCAPEAGGPAAG